MHTNVKILVMGILDLFWSIPIYYLTKVDMFQFELTPQQKENLFIPPDKIKINFPFTQKKKNTLNEFKQCAEYENMIMEKNVTKLGDVFNRIDIGNIHILFGRKIGILILTIVICILQILIVVYLASCPDLSHIINVLLKIVKFAAMAVNFIFFILLVFFYEIASLADYNDFLECPNVNRQEFNKIGNTYLLQIFLFLFCLVYLFKVSFILKRREEELN